MSIQWSFLITLLAVALSATASAHVILYKRDVRAAIGWVGLIWLSPFIGAVLYALLGVNRIRRRAGRLKAQPGVSALQSGVLPRLAVDARYGGLPAGHPMRTLAQMVERITSQPLKPGNRVVPLVGGDEAYPAMLEAIETASRTVALMTYIFDDDDAGRDFVAALIRARDRGVQVKVLIDGVGAKYSRPTITQVLAGHGITVAEFLSSPWVPTHLAYMNMRNHRKILVVDGSIGFTGGMNIRQGTMLSLKSAHPIQDLHFRFECPVVAHLTETFLSDWNFATGEALPPVLWLPGIEQVGPALARGVPDGPDEHFEAHRWMILGALAEARSRVRVITPYFLPDQTLVTALNTAALRGIDVEIIVPRKNNLRFVQWASTAGMWQLLQSGVRIWQSPPPFDHTKVMVVDDSWSMVGSSNWDPRSLRLNFEFNVEVYHAELALRLGDIFEAKRREASEVTLDRVNSRPLPVKLRDGVARLFSPYL